MRRAVYAGSFDPITCGHLWMVEHGSRLFDGLIVAAGVDPDKRYLFPLAERLAMVREAVSGCSNVGLRQQPPVSVTFHLERLPC